MKQTIKQHLKYLLYGILFMMIMSVIIGFVFWLHTKFPTFTEYAIVSTFCIIILYIMGRFLYITIINENYDDGE